MNHFQPIKKRENNGSTARVRAKEAWFAKNGRKLHERPRARVKVRQNKGKPSMNHENK